jgi:hypothetical protein
MHERRGPRAPNVLSVYVYVDVYAYIYMHMYAYIYIGICTYICMQIYFFIEF